jgi:hypothetical protein
MQPASAIRLLVLLAIVSACGDPHAARTAAGAGAANRGWRVDARPAAGFAAAVSTPLADVRAATRLPSGEVVVADAHAAELRWYDRRGRLVRSVGGERADGVSFSSLGGLWQTDDGELVAWDPLEFRLSTFTPQGRLRSSRDFPADRLDLFPHLAGVFGDGSLLLQSAQDLTFVVAAHPRREPFLLLRYSFGTGRLDTLRRELGPEQLTWGDSTRAARQPVPMGHHTAVAAGGDRLWVADSQERTVRSYPARDGAAAAATADLAAQTRALTPAEREDHRARFLSAARRLGGRSAAEQFAGHAAMPAATLPFTALHVDRAGNAWLRHGDPATPDLWTIIRPDGRRVGTLSLPAGLDVLEIGDDYVLGSATDAAGRAHVRLHRLRK